MNPTSNTSGGNTCGSNSAARHRQRNRSRGNATRSFSGSWCQLVFSRKIRDLDPASARAVNDAIELELARGVCSLQPNAEPTPAHRLAA